MKKLSLLIVIQLLILFNWIRPELSAQGYKRIDTSTVPDQIVVEFDAGRYELAKGETDEYVIVEKFHQTTSPGDPILPQKIFDVVVPPTIDWNSLQIELSPEVELIPGKHDIMPAKPYMTIDGDEEIVDWGKDKHIIDGKNMNVYGKDQFYPAEAVELHSISQMRKWKFIKLIFYPVQYNPVARQLRYIPSVRVVIKFRKYSTPERIDTLMLRDKVMDVEAKERFYNIGKQTFDWYRPLGPDSLEPLPAPYDYVIITTENIKTSPETGLTDFIAHKTNQGHNVLVVTEVDYGTLTGQPPDGTAEKIRKWLFDYYIAYGIKWVLLIGNPDPDDPNIPDDAVGDIPMKMCWPNKNSYIYRESPTDYFYANLTSNWDLDGDQYYGEDYSHSNQVTPDPLIFPDTYSIEWKGEIEFDEDGLYSFWTISDEGIRVIIDGNTIVDDFTPHNLPKTDGGSIDIDIAEVGNKNITIRYFNTSNEGNAILYWKKPSSASFELIPSDKLYHETPVAILPGGLNGEYFNNEDFTSLALTRIDPVINFYWGTGDKGPGGTDFTSDVYVGRIPVYGEDYATLNNILDKIIQYQTEQFIPEWHRKFLFTAVWITDRCTDLSDDYLLGEELKLKVADPLRYTTYRIYESDYGIVPPPECDRINDEDPDPSAPCNMLGELVNGGGYGFLTWSTHGGPSSASGILRSTQCTHLNDATPFFAFQGSCNNGYPEDVDNLGYQLLVQGAIATVSASRVSWSWCFSPPPNPTDGRNFNLSYHYTMRMLNGGPAGRALYRTKEDVAPGSIWMNKMDFNLYGDPTTSLLKPYEARNVDVMHILDNSGSMSGYTSSSYTDRKIDILTGAANQFVDMMEMNGENKLGLVKFSTTATTLLNLQTLDAGAKSNAHTQIGGIIPDAMTSIGGGLENGITEFTTNPSAGHRKVMLLVTDGMENTDPMILDKQPDIIEENITVYPLGLGYGTGIDEGKLIALANATGGDYRITDDDIIFKKYFLEILASAVDWTMITDPVGNLANGSVEDIPVNVTRDQESVSFTAYWSGLDNAVTFTILTPSGDEITPTAAVSNSKIIYTSSPRYAIYKVDFPLEGNLSNQWQGTWNMRVKGNSNIPAGETVRYSASALAKGGTDLEVSFDKVNYQTGDKIQIIAKLIRNDTRLTGAKINVYGDVPLVSVGNVLHENKVSLDEITQGRMMNGDQLTMADSKLEILNKRSGFSLLKRGTTDFELFDDGEHGDCNANDGIYGNYFEDTKKSGAYTFRFVASGIPTSDIVQTTTREWTKSLYNDVNIDPKSSDINIKLVSTTKDGNSYSIIATPRDIYHNYLGPGHDVYLVVIKSSGQTKIELENSNVDGVYTNQFTLTKKEVSEGVKLRFGSDGKDITELELPSTRQFGLSLHGGYSMPLSTMQNDFESGFGLIVDFEYYLNRNYSLLLNAGYNIFKSKTAGIDDLNITNISLNIKFNNPISSQHGFYYFVHAGPGYYLTNQNINNIGANAGAGISYNKLSSLRFDAGVDYNVVFNEDLSFVRIYLGIIHTF